MIPIGLQLYSIREDCARDLSHTLEAVAQMGYAGVEFAGYYGYGAQELRSLLDSVGLKCCGTHIGLDTLLGDELPRAVEFNQVLGNEYLIVPGLAEARRSSRAAWRDTAQVFNEIAARLQPHGMRTGYHNHWVEFEPLDGELPWDTFFGNTRHDVIMQLDIGNALHGGGDPIPYIARYPGRAITVHLKEHSATDPTALIGEGDVPWQRVFDLCEREGGTEWYIVEQESYKYPPLEVVARCLDQLRRMGKA
jgi:sugar phosphate isomerase/epimerase